jgi:hypothetical protein
MRLRQTAERFYAADKAYKAASDDPMVKQSTLRELAIERLKAAHAMAEAIMAAPEYK